MHDLPRRADTALPQAFHACCHCCLQFIDMLRKGVLKDLACFYNSSSRKFHTVIQLGRCAAGEGAAAGCCRM